ncbi:hypothetical protein D3C73_1620260 [compost metagenome]
MITDLNVVGDLDLVVELHTITENGIGQCAAVDSGIHANLYIVTDQHTTDLGNFLPDTFLIGKTETFAAEHGT